MQWVGRCFFGLPFPISSILENQIVPKQILFDIQRWCTNLLWSAPFWASSSRVEMPEPAMPPAIPIEQLLFRLGSRVQANNIGIFGNSSVGKSTLLTFLLEKAIELGIQVVGMDFTWSRQQSSELIEFVKTHPRGFYWNTWERGIPTLSDFAGQKGAMIVINLPLPREDGQPYPLAVNVYQVLIEYAKQHKPCLLFIDNWGILGAEPSFTSQIARDCALSPQQGVGVVLVSSSYWRYPPEILKHLDIRLFGGMTEGSQADWERVFGYPRRSLDVCSHEYFGTPSGTH